MFSDQCERIFIISIFCFFLFELVHLTLVAASFGPRLTPLAGCLWSPLCCLCKFPHECQREFCSWISGNYRIILFGGSHWYGSLSPVTHLISFSQNHRRFQEFWLQKFSSHTEIQTNFTWFKSPSINSASETFTGEWWQNGWNRSTSGYKAEFMPWPRQLAVSSWQVLRRDLIFWAGEMKGGQLGCFWHWIRKKLFLRQHGRTKVM